MYFCEKCKKDFNKKYLLVRHQNRKKPCDNIDNININYDKQIQDKNNLIEQTLQKSLETKTLCLFCNSILINKGNLTRHINTFCKVKKEMVQDINKIIEEKNKLIEQKNKQLEIDDNKYIREQLLILLKENKELKKNTSQNTPQNITINNPTINNTINQNNLVVINPFGKEDLSHITLEDYKIYLKGFFPGFIKFIEKIHFDDNSNNKNICITNLKSKYLSVHDGNKWITRDKNEVIEKLMENKLNILTDKCEEFEESNKINKKIAQNFEEFCENYNDDKAQKSTKNDIITMIYDNKDKIKGKNKINKKNDVDKEDDNYDSEADIKIKKKPNKSKKKIVEDSESSDSE